MALTAPNTTGTYSPFWALQSDHVQYSMSQNQGRAKDAWTISKYSKGYPTKDAMAALAVLIGAVPGTTALSTSPAVPNPAGPSAAVPVVTGIGDLGGLRTAVTYTSINRATTAADVTELKRWFSTALRESGITYPTAIGSTMMRGAMHANMPGFS